ncbi:FAAP20 [Branchiostoma lanceolatum]|uniref:FAAP20 protein n=1 Tax=Branchiostoma lanceolatum TaxID=7740 RepID=A0A8J9VK68_BRALA|nr:FAAP20 [Branchiostoma lanceolatum]
MKRKTNLQENEIDQTAPIVTHVRGVSSDAVLSSLKSQGAIKTAGSQLSMHKDAERDRPKYQAINARGPKGGVKRLASQTAGLETFTSGGKTTGSSPKGRPVRVAPLFKRSASAVQTEVGPGPSTSRAQPRGGGGEEELRSGSGDGGVLRSCPMCQEQFPPGMSQLDMDGHIAACLSASSEDIMW